MGPLVSGRGQPRTAPLRLGLDALALSRCCWYGPLAPDSPVAQFPGGDAYYRVYAPETTSLTELIAVAGQRWQIEAAFEGAKGEVGLDHYEVRLWQAWYRHITLVLLAYAALVVARSTTGKKGA